MSTQSANPAWDGIKCIVCQNADPAQFTLRFKKTDCEIVECRVCSFHFIPPFFRRQIDYTRYKTSDVTAEIKKSNPWLKVQRNLLRFELIQKYQPTGRILDVGAGFGHFLLAARQLGYVGAGIEMSRANVEFARNELGLQVKLGNFLDEPAQEYDILTLWDVLEHIDAADQVLEKATEMLKPGGFIFIQVPQWQSFFARIFKDKWWAMGLDHVNYFSKKTIRQLLENYGFEVKTIQSSIELKNIFTYVILPKLRRGKKAVTSWTSAERQQEFNRLTKRPQWLLWIFVKAHNLIYKMLACLHVDDEMIVVAQRKMQ
jgi:2-polyprenyl-3-methyl-5-hydroxy-6-metoxy-1,4-benzoquinol methylase